MLRYWCDGAVNGIYQVVTRRRTGAGCEPFPISLPARSGGHGHRPAWVTGRRRHLEHPE